MIRCVWCPSKRPSLRRQGESSSRRCVRPGLPRRDPAKALPPAPPLIPAGLPSDLLRRRPDIRAAERDLAASTADIGVAVADLYPRFTLTAAPALVSTALASLLTWASRSYSIGAALDWPLFNGGLTRGNIAVANARQDQALISSALSVGYWALNPGRFSFADTRYDQDPIDRCALSFTSRGDATSTSRILTIMKSKLIFAALSLALMCVFTTRAITSAIVRQETEHTCHLRR